MKLRKINNRGFSHVELAIVVLVVAVLGLVGYRVLKNTSHAGSLCSGQTFQFGSTGKCVKDLQTLSIANTSIIIGISGTFDSSTKSNIIALQKNNFPNETKWTGIVGLDTWKILCNSYSNGARNQAVYDAQKDACGHAVFTVAATGPNPNPIPNKDEYYIRGYMTYDGQGHIWVAQSSGGGLSVINPKDGSLFQFIYNIFYGLGTMSHGGITYDGQGHIWVTNSGGNSVTEINAKDGSLVKIYTGASYGFNGPSSIAADNLGHVWIGNSIGNSVTEINAKDGSLVQVISSSNYGISYPWKIISDNHGNIWILDRSSKDFKGHITEINAKDGSLVRYLTFSQWGDTTDLGYDNLGHIWVVTAGAGLAEIDSNSGSLIKIIPGYFESIASDNLGHIWVTNPSNSHSSVKEINVKDGSLVKEIKDPSYKIYNPQDIISDNLGHIWVTNNDALTEINANDASLVRAITTR